IKQSRHTLGREDHVAAIGAPHEVKGILATNGLGVADQKLVAAGEFNQECAKGTTSAECPARNVELVPRHATASVPSTRIVRTPLNSKSIKPPSGPMNPAPPPLIARRGCGISND